MSVCCLTPILFMPLATAASPQPEIKKQFAESKLIMLTFLDMNLNLAVDVP